MTSDAELVARAKRGNTDAFGLLVDRYQRSVSALALAELRDIHAAEDVAQSALLSAFRRLATLRDGAKFGPWLLQIARRQVVDELRRSRVGIGLSLGEHVATSGSSCQLPPWVEHQHLLTLVARLPEPERVVVGLRYFDGHSTADISQIIGRPLGTVTKQLSRAVGRLRAWHEEEMQ